MKTRRTVLMQLAALFTLNILIFVLFVSVLSSKAVIYKQGSTGETVRQIQTNLKKWGYYTGSVDGIYGSKTVSAVKSFQSKNGLTADGVVGNQTLAALGLSSSGNAGGYSSSSNDLYLLARIISAEARGEPYKGQVAVGAVVLNRVRHPSFPNTVSGVVYQNGAFTAIVDGQFNQPISSQSYQAAQDALNGWDPSGGAIYYYNPAKTTNTWIYSREVITVIGSHYFAR